MDSGSIQLVIVILTQLFLFKVTPFKKAFCVCDCHVMTHTKARFVTNDQCIILEKTTKINKFFLLIEKKRKKKLADYN